MLVGKVIAGYRKAENISVRELAARIGVEHSALWRFEQGKPIKTKLWVAIVKWLLTETE